MSAVLLAVLLAACAPVAPPVEAPPATPPVDPGDVAVRYRLALPRPAGHLVEVEATTTVAAAGPSVWRMAVWTPGSYLVREYARNVEGVEAVGADGAPLPVRKVAKNRWQVDVPAPGPLSFRYRVYAREPGVRAAHVDADHAVLNGAAVFVVPVDADGPFAVSLELPDGWDVATALPVAPEGEHVFLARDLDHLLDAPIVAGALDVRELDVPGAPHRLVTVDAEGLWDVERSARDVARVATAVSAFWGEQPYDAYTFLHVVGTPRGGLEHADSTLVYFPAEQAPDDDGWVKWLGLVSHEHFHAWNVKALRPAELRTYDYEAEQLTPGLWVAEGLTSYYDDLLLVRAGLMTPEQHLAALAEAVNEVTSQPGAQVQSLSQASVDTWIKFYRPDENSPNTSVSYYRKGAVVGWMLDVAIRRATSDRRSLDDAMRLLYERHRRDGYRAEDVRAVASEVAGADLGPFFDAWVDGTAPLDLAPTLEWLGLRRRPHAADPAAGGWIGLDAHGTPWVVRRVLRGTPADEAGLDVGDELIALDGHRLSPERWPLLAARYGEGDTAELLVARRGRLRTLTVTFRAPPQDRGVLEIDPEAGPMAARRRAAWWGRSG